MSYLSDPDRLERIAVYVQDEPPNTSPNELAEALNDAAERIRSLQARLADALRRLGEAPPADGTVPADPPPKLCPECGRYCTGKHCKVKENH